MKVGRDGSGMLVSARRKLVRASAFALVAGSALALAGCGSSSPRGEIKSARSKEYFAESEYGVKASPRVSDLRTRLPRGGGRDMVGKPYKVKGQWYKPKEEPGYRKTGAASWYGDAFHGRLTANGEIYDQTHLTAAHPTMPLPSYARVTNMKNGSSVIVRVNDRGPFTHGRVIDLSRRAAEMLDYKHAGVAQVQVDYLGRAPLHGRDDQFLLASYRPGKGGGSGPRIDDGLPAGVMIAMNGRTPSNPVRSAPLPAAPSAPAYPSITLASAQMPAYSVASAGDPVLPDFGPIILERPTGGWARPLQVQMASLGPLSYADERVASAAQAFQSLDTGLSPTAIVAAWKRRSGGVTIEGAEYVAAGTFASRRDAEALAGRLAAFGTVEIETDADSHSVMLIPQASGDADRLAELARGAGAAEAFVVRN